MDSNADKNKHDALDALLRRYLAERDHSGLLEASGESMLEQEPVVVPSADREADMISRLQRKFPEAPQPVVHVARWRKVTFYATVAGIATIAAILLIVLKPFGAASPELNSNGTLNGPGTAGKADDVHKIEIKEFDVVPNVKDGDLETPSTPERDGINKRSNNGPHSWLNHPGAIPSSTLVNDVPNVQAAVLNPLAQANIVPAEPLDPFPLRGLYAQTSTDSRFHMLEPDSDHLIRGRKGTLLYIPRNAFVDASSGEAVKEMVQLEVKEVYSRSEFLKTNLPTVSNGRQLVSGGVVYVDAVASGRRLALAKGKDIYLEYASSYNTDLADMELNLGMHNDRGEMNWIKGQSQTAKMVPMDLDKLYFDEFYCDCQGEKLWNNLLWAITDQAFADTWIATREFRQRLHALASLNYFSTGLMAYRNNVDKDLWKVDKIVANLVREQIAQGQATEASVEVFEAFSRDQLTQVEPFNDHGVDLGRADARKQLLLRNVSREETEQLIRMDRLRKEYADEVASRLVLAHNGSGTYVARVKAGQVKGSPKRGIRGFFVKQLGWMNLAKPVGREMLALRDNDIKVRLTGEVPYESTRTFLVYNNILSIMPGTLTTGQLFRFKDIPKGMESRIVAIGFKDGFPYLGIESVPRDGDAVITVAMRRLNLDDFAQALAALD